MHAVVYYIRYDIIPKLNEFCRWMLLMGVSSQHQTYPECFVLRPCLSQCNQRLMESPQMYHPEELRELPMMLQKLCSISGFCI